MRKAGILMPVASLPSNYGIGDFGKTSYQFIDIISNANMKIWQLLPLNPLGYGNSPYQPYSSYAMDELYIGLDLLVEDKLLDYVPNYLSKSKTINYDKVRKFKRKYIEKAYNKFIINDDYNKFLEYEWVYDYAIFITLKKVNNLSIWSDWPKEHKEWIINKKFDVSIYQKQINIELFIQYLLYKQWMQLKSYANSKGISMMGDIPIYVGIDSLDVWMYQKGFLLNDKGEPTYIAGCPPDYFTEYGQRWGNPIYNWKQLEKDGFKFWLDRLSYSSKLFNTTRIDHFRAFDTYWKIPSSCETAVIGEWVEAPGYKLFDKLFETYPDIDIVVEDLGDLRKEVLELRDHYNLIGMRIVQHSFDPVNTMTQDRKHLLAYTGTHDNESIRYWYSNIPTSYRKKMSIFFKKHNILNDNIVDNMIEYTLKTQANLVILSIVDILHKTDKYRINFPGTVGSPNWEMKLKDYNELKVNLINIKKLIKESNR